METVVLTLALAWSVKTGCVVGPPVIAGDTVWVASADKRLYEINAVTGKKTWTKRFRAPLAASPVVADGMAFCNVPMPEGRLYAFRVKDHKRIWRERAGSGVVNVCVNAGVVATAVGRDAAFFGVSDGGDVGEVAFKETVQGLVPAGTGFVALLPSGVWAFCETRAPRPVWTVDIGPGATLPAVSDAAAFGMNGAGELIAVGLADGRELWRRSLGEPAATAPVLSAAGIIACGRRSVSWVNGADGVVEWKAAVGGNVVGAAAAAWGALVVCEDGRILAADGRGITVLATMPATAVSGPVVSGDRVWVGDRRGVLNCYIFQ